MNKMAEFRKKNGLSQVELSIILDIHKDYVSSLERGRKLPSFKLAKKIADYFKVSIDELIFFDHQ